MKAKELRIGNWVCVNHAFKSQSELEDYSMLTKIDGLGDGFISWDKSYGFHHEGIFPIPLTEEWLVKFGFEEYDRMGDNIFFAFKKEDNFKFNLHLFFLELSVSFYGLNWERAIKLKYVNQLQNLYFAITGEELAIE